MPGDRQLGRTGWDGPAGYSVTDIGLGENALVIETSGACADPITGLLSVPLPATMPHPRLEVRTTKPFGSGTAPLVVTAGHPTLATLAGQMAASEANPFSAATLGVCVPDALAGVVVPVTLDIDEGTTACGSFATTWEIHSVRLTNAPGACP